MVCVLAVAIPSPGDPGSSDPVVELFEGVVEGVVAEARRGEGGFGYDPIFLLPSGVTTAELPDADKDAISHRGRAVAAALPRLQSLLEGLLALRSRVRARTMVRSQAPFGLA